MDLLCYTLGPEDNLIIYKKNNKRKEFVQLKHVILRLLPMSFGPDPILSPSRPEPKILLTFASRDSLEKYGINYKKS